MAWDPLLADRVREVLAERRNLREKRMFGCLGFLCQGNFAVAVLDDGLIVRLGLEAQQEALDEPGVTPFAPGGSPMRGWVLVSGEVMLTDGDLRDWVERGWRFASCLPAKG